MHYANSYITNHQLPNHFEPRDALLRTLDQHVKKRFLFLAAPAGYGKTITTLLWLRKRQANFAWIGLEEYDNIPSLFYRLIGDALRSFDPENATLSTILAQSDFALTPIENLIRMIDELASSEEERFLVFDDLHLINNVAIYKSLLLIQRRLPKNFHLIMLTRNHIREEIIENIGPERCEIFHSTDLAFTPLEIQALYQKQQHPVSLDEAIRIYHATHGWPLGVAAFAQKGYRHIDQSKLLEDFIEEELWDSWEPALQQFMLKTAILDILTPDICDALTESTNSRQQLEVLRVANSFVRQTGQESYRYHQLFIDFLREKAAKKLDLTTLHKIAANHYWAQKDYIRGTHHAMLSQDEEMILRTMVVSNQLQNPSVDEYIYFSQVLNTAELPETLCQKYPFLYVFRIGYYYIMGDVTNLEKYLDRLEAALPTIEKEQPEHYLTCCLELMCDPRKPVGMTVDCYQAVLDAIEKKHGKIQVEMFSITTQAPFLHRSLENFVELTDALIAEKSEALFTRLMQMDGRLLVQGIRCGLYLEQNKLNAALEMALNMQHHLSNCENIEFRYGAMLIIAKVYYTLGEITDYQNQIRKVEDYIFNHAAPYLYPNVLAFKTKLRLWEGDVQAAENWLAQYYIEDDPYLKIPKLYQYFTTVRSNLVLGKNTQAMKLAAQLETLCDAFERPIDLAEARVLSAILEWQQGHEKKAHDWLLRALDAVSAYQFVNVIANEGAAVLPILNSIDPKKHPNLDEAFFHNVLVTAYEISTKRSGVTVTKEKPIKLSKQQIRITTYLAKGYTYREIMEETGLTIHTVKSHVSAAYKKLGVNNASDAVAKAKRLGLLD